MKKKRLYYNLLLLLLISFIIYKNGGISLSDNTTYTKCGNLVVPTGIFSLTSISAKIMQIFVPIGMIIFGSFDFIKTIVSNNNSKKTYDLETSKKLFLKRMILGCSVFFVFTIVQSIINITADDTSYTSCLSCAFKGGEYCDGFTEVPFKYDYPEAQTIADLPFKQPKLRKDAYKDNDNKGSGNSSSNNNSAGDSNEIVKYAEQYVGIPYVYGGTSLTSGVDCSGFVQQVFAHFNINLPRIANDQAGVGQTIGNIDSAKPGDLLFFDWDGDGVMDHVSIYVGNGEKIHASGDESCNGVTANGCQVKVDTNSVTNASLIKRIK